MNLSSPFFKQINFQYQQHKVFLNICIVFVLGIIYGSLFHSQEKKLNLAFLKGFNGSKDRKFIQHQVLNIIRSKNSNLSLKTFPRINRNLISKYLSLNL
jgi:hypothetical protein